jgi:hypothetical protein
MIDEDRIAIDDEELKSPLIGKILNINCLVSNPKEAKFAMFSLSSLDTVYNS